MNIFEHKYEQFMNSLIYEATTKIEHNQINSIRKELKKLKINNEFYILLPNGKKAGPFNKLRQVSLRSKSCKADAEIYNSNNKDIKSIFISLKDYAFRQFGGREDLFGQKIYKNMTDDASKKILENKFINSKYNLIKKVFDKLGEVKITKDGYIYDFRKLKNKIKKFKKPMISFKIPKKELDFFNPCKFGYNFLNSIESNENNVDLVLIGEMTLNQINDNTVELITANEKSSIEWNSNLYGETEKNKLLDKFKMYLCFIYDEGRHVFGEFKNCRFVIWPEYKVLNWINEEDIKKFINSK